MINVLINVLTCKTFEMNEGVLCFSKLYIGFLQRLTSQPGKFILPLLCFYVIPL